MDARFLDYYNRELAYLREMGGEFADAFPQVACRLGMQGDTVADPYVERLLEGFAFLAARVHVKLDAEFPRFSQRLLEVVYPHYLAPTPSMAIAALELGSHDPAGELAPGECLPRGTRMQGDVAGECSTPCTFVTAHDVEVWPIEILEARAELPGSGTPAACTEARIPVRGVIRLRLRLRYPPRGSAERVMPDRLVFHIAADEPAASQLYEAVLGHARGVAVGLPGGAREVVAARDTIRPEGFDAGQALLPIDARVFQGYRLLHEYFAFPSRFHFFSLNGIGHALRRLGSETFEIELLLDRDPATVKPFVSRKSFALNCVPVVNLFPSVGNRLHVLPSASEHHVVVDRTRPMDFEVYRVHSVAGFDRANDRVRTFHPFYRQVGDEREARNAYFSTRREPRRISDKVHRSGGRSGYLGSEVFVSLVDTREAPWPERIEQLEVEMLLTNRDLSLLLPTGAPLAIETNLSLSRARIIRGPSRPRSQVAEREMTWRLISHLSLNYLALRDLDAGSGAAVLRELLGLYASLADPDVARHADSIVASDAQAVNRRLPVAGPLVFGRGVAVTLTVDERQFAGCSPYLFGALLEQFLSRHVSMNMFCEFALATVGRGRLAAWPPRWGGRPDV